MNNLELAFYNGFTKAAMSSGIGKLQALHLLKRAMWTPPNLPSGGSLKGMGQSIKNVATNPRVQAGAALGTGGVGVGVGSYMMGAEGKNDMAQQLEQLKQFMQTESLAKAQTGGAQMAQQGLGNLDARIDKAMAPLASKIGPGGLPWWAWGAGGLGAGAVGGAMLNQDNQDEEQGGAHPAPAPAY